MTVDTENGAVGWASPMLSNGNISVGIASGCDFPLVQGGLSVFSQADGSLVGSYKTVGPDDPTYGPLGGTIWATPAEAPDSSSPVGLLDVGGDRQRRRSGPRFGQRGFDFDRAPGQPECDQG